MAIYVRLLCDVSACVCVCVCVCVCAVLGCADLALPDHQMSAERTDDVTTVTCNATGERWHFLCRRRQWYGTPLTNCTTRRTYNTTVCPPRRHRTETRRGLERIQALADISRSALCCRSNETCAPIAKPPNGAQLEGAPTYHTPKLRAYIRVRAVVWECGEGQTDRHTDGRDQYTFRVVCDSREM